MIRIFQDKRRLGLLVLCYILWALCYPPFNLGPLAFFVLAPVIFISAQLSRRRVLAYNFIGGLFYNLIMYYWIYNVMKVGPALIIFLGLVLLIVYLSLFNALTGLAVRWFKNSRLGWLGYGLFWAGLEVARTKGQMSFPWSHMGYTLSAFLPLIQAVSLIGVFGLSFLIAACNFLLARAALAGRRLPAAAVPAVIACLLVYGLFHLREPAAYGASQRADISLVQPAIEQTKKWNEKYFNDVMNQTYGLMDTHNLVNSDLVILAETAVPAFIRHRPIVIADFYRRSDSLKTDIIVGSLDFEKNDHPGRPFRFYNSAFLFQPGFPDTILQYSKLKLVPFSERLPFDNIFPILNYVNLGEGDFCEGERQMFWGEKFLYSPTVCYEIVYPAFVRSIKKGGAQCLINITNDGWFGKSPAPYQHAGISRLRAVELGLPVARCANSGISIFYDYKGRIVARTKLFEQTVLRAQLPLHSQQTVYETLGPWVEDGLFWIFLASLSIFFSRAVGNRMKKRLRG